MFGFLPDGVACCCACATRTGLLIDAAEAAASVVPPSRILRRLTSLSFTFLLVPFSSLTIDHFPF
jgi:hypothetical protein